MTKSKINLDLSRLGDGALQAKFDKEFERVTKNILDPNTDAKKKRSVTIKLTVSPNDKRNVSDVDIEVKSSLAPQVAVTTTVMTGQNINTGQVAATELKSGTPGQTYIDPDDSKVKLDDGTPVDDVDPDGKKPADNIIDYQRKEN